MSELQPGVRALVLPHWLVTLNFTKATQFFKPGDVVTVRGAPMLGLEVNTGFKCLICRVQPDGGPGNLVWPASALLPLPPDDEAKRLFSETIVTVMIPNPNYREKM